ncbi:hypothetical protein Bca4012_065227 [Brassica carinata]|uniref:Uncharacterized protein n=1 Tax=Brassica carinata TaxID=52824 RepID=A0A8X8AYJ7_BRACI|nr:hypothetical protein Bca52824_017654 [Brassica carinata]
MEVGLDSFQRRPLNSDEEDDDAIDSDDEPGGNLYEYEEGVPEEESRKNNCYDRHDNYDYELSEDFETISLMPTYNWLFFPDKPEKCRASQLFKAAFDSIDGISIRSLDDIPGTSVTNFFRSIRSTLDFDFEDENCLR